MARKKKATEKEVVEDNKKEYILKKDVGVTRSGKVKRPKDSTVRLSDEEKVNYNLQKLI